MVYTILLPRFTYIKWFHIELKCRIQPKKVSLNQTIKIYQKIIKLDKIVRNFSEKCNMKIQINLLFSLLCYIQYYYLDLYDII